MLFVQHGNHEAQSVATTDHHAHFKLSLTSGLFLLWQILQICVFLDLVFSLFIRRLRISMILSAPNENFNELTRRQFQMKHHWSLRNIKTEEFAKTLTVPLARHLAIDYPGKLFVNHYNFLILVR